MRHIHGRKKAEIRGPRPKAKMKATALIGVCLDSRYAEGKNNARLQAIIDLANNTCKKYFLLITDILYAKNLKFKCPNQSETALNDMALNACKEFLSNNESILQTVNSNGDIIYWKDLVKNKTCQNMIKAFKALYTSTVPINNAFKEGIDSTVHEYVARIEKQRDLRNLRNDITEQSVSYVLEEWSVVTWLALHYRIDYYAYLSRPVASYHAARQYFFKDESDQELLKWQTIFFRNESPSNLD